MLPLFTEVYKGYGGLQEVTVGDKGLRRVTWGPYIEVLFEKHIFYEKVSSVKMIIIILSFISDTL